MGIKEFNENALIDFQSMIGTSSNKNIMNGVDEDTNDLNSEGDPLFEEAVELVIDMNSASASLLQRRFKIGYSRAGMLIDQMEYQGIITGYEGSKPREVLIEKDEWQKIKNSSDCKFNKTNNSNIETLGLEYVQDDVNTQSIEDINALREQKIDVSLLPNLLVVQPKINIIEEIMDNIVAKTLPSEVKVIILNEDFIKLNEYNGLPHLMIPIVTDPKKSQGAINWLSQEMLCRYNTINSIGVRNIQEYNQRASKTLPELIILIDEFSEVYNADPSVIENVMCNLLSRGLDVGIHIIFSTKYDMKYINWGKILGFVQVLDDYKYKDMIKRIIDPISTDCKSTNLLDELDKIDFNMDGFEFEKYAKDILNSNGFCNIDVTKSSGDYGADVIAYKDDVKYAIQCKKYSQPVGISAIQEVIASKTIYKCHVAAVLTNNVFTNNAIELAMVNNVLLWDRKKLQEFIRNIILE